MMTLTYLITCHCDEVESVGRGNWKDNGSGGGHEGSLCEVSESRQVVDIVI